jgi:hypothetical protein
VGISGAGFAVRLVVRLVAAGLVVRLLVVVVLRALVLRLLLLRLLLLRPGRPGMALPLVPGTVSGGTDGTSDGIAA